MVDKQLLEHKNIIKHFIHWNILQDILILHMDIQLILAFINYFRLVTN